MSLNTAKILGALDNLNEDATYGALDIEFVRELNNDDLEIARLARTGGHNDPPKGSHTYKALRATHHSLARYLAAEMLVPNAALMTGYTSEYIEQLVANNAAFQDLIEHYRQNPDVPLPDAQTQMQDLGLNTLATLRERLEDESAQFTIGQLQEQINLLLVKPMSAKAAAGNGVAPPIQITFVTKPTALALAPIESAPQNADN